MSIYQPSFEIHVHGQVPLRADVTSQELDEILKPLWRYAGARSLKDGAISHYEEEPGLQFNQHEHTLQICWTVLGNEDFHQVMEDVCMNLNEASRSGAALEVTFYDTEFEDAQETDSNAQSRDDFVMLFVGPDPAAIMQVQRDMLVQDVVQLMERHFESAELDGVVGEIDKLFTQRLDDLVSSLRMDVPPRGQNGHGGGRKQRRLH
ncbi:hypothetical protein KIK84_02980 [Curvibacter sp. CHRR-16]|uniref:DUF6806 family protein n=1 Tax=Curvibacter sp. CHRR-16 TaxID=2835872 RepID=UPI001BDA39F5|nr:DUF6806 family protein [Curvibacter sp. CHRR-16]MBT0569275.1 hypothetical protein [Curvibacter sp. CHRR-16]